MTNSLFALGIIESSQTSENSRPTNHTDVFRLASVSNVTLNEFKVAYLFRFSRASMNRHFCEYDARTVEQFQE